VRKTKKFIHFEEKKYFSMKTIFILKYMREYPNLST